MSVYQGIGFKNGEKYLGFTLNGKRSGKGTQYYSNGKIMYSGFWKEDEYCGNGDLFGDIIYSGGFKKGKKHGDGIEFKNGNLIRSGVWYMGNFIREN